VIPHTAMARFLLLSCFVCLLGAQAAHAQTALPPQGAPQASTLFERFASKQWTLDCEGEHCILTGQVELAPPGGQVKFFADRIEIFNDKHLLVASGNVVFSNPEGRIAAERVEFDLAANTGTFHVASGLMPLGEAADPEQFGNQDADVYFWGETIEKLGDRKYRVTRGGFTTCVQPTLSNSCAMPSPATTATVQTPPGAIGAARRSSCTPGPSSRPPRSPPTCRSSSGARVSG